MSALKAIIELLLRQPTLGESLLEHCDGVVAIGITRAHLRLVHAAHSNCALTLRKVSRLALVAL